MERQDPKPDAEPLADTLPELTVAPTIQEVRAALASQVRTLEFVSLCRAFILTFKREPQTESTLNAYIALHSTRDEALKKLDAFLIFIENEDNRNALAERFQQDPETAIEDPYLHNHRLENLGYAAFEVLATPHCAPFDVVHDDVERCLQISDETIRNAAFHEINDRLDALFASHDVRVRQDFDDLAEKLTKESLLSYDRVPELIVSFAGKEREVSLFSIPDIFRGLRRLAFLEKIGNVLPKADHEAIARDTLAFGAKNANLMEMRRCLPKLQEVCNGICKVDIPDFIEIPVALYDQWKSGESIDNQLHQYFEWASGGAVLARSSAVYSEDNETVTGAGIYDSTEIEEAADFETFKRACIQVYESVEAERAVEYRRLNDIPHEKMGITLQRKIDRDFYDHDRSGPYGKGTINSSRAYAPELLDVIDENGAMPIIKKDLLEQWMARDGWSDEGIFYYELDISRNDNIHLYQNAAALGYYLEKMYGVSVQAEFIADGRAMQLLQTRILPAAHRAHADVKFPEEEPLLVRDAMGVLNEELDILPHDRKNGEKKGLVIFRRSYFASNHDITPFLPKEGAVMVLVAAREHGGHIETQCIERGLTCIFQSRSDNSEIPVSVDVGYSASPSYGGSAQLENIVGIEGHRRVRVVANGIEARLYPASSASVAVE